MPQPLDLETEKARDEHFDLIFRNHRPSTSEVGERLDRVTELTIEYAKALDDLMPDEIGNYFDQLWINLQQVSMWAKATIARHQD